MKLTAGIEKEFAVLQGERGLQEGMEYCMITKEQEQSSVHTAVLKRRADQDWIRDGRIKLILWRSLLIAISIS